MQGRSLRTSDLVVSALGLGCMAALLFLMFPLPTCIEGPMEPQAKDDHLTVGHRVHDIVKHPAFKGFGEHLLPWTDNARYLRHAAGTGRLAHAVPQSRGRRRRGGRPERPHRRSGRRQDDLLRFLHRAAEAGGSDQEAHRPLLPPGKAGSAVRHRLSGRRVLLRRLAPRGLPARAGDQPEGAQRLRDQVSRGRAAVPPRISRRPSRMCSATPRN